MGKQQKHWLSGSVSCWAQDILQILSVVHGAMVCQWLPKHKNWISIYVYIHVTFRHAGIYYVLTQQHHIVYRDYEKILTMINLS